LTGSTKLPGERGKSIFLEKMRDIHIFSHTSLNKRDTFPPPRPHESLQTLGILSDNNKKIQPHSHRKRALSSLIMNFSCDGSLTELYDQAASMYHSIENGQVDDLQESVKKCMSSYEKCSSLIRSNSVFSTNESLSDLSTRRLAYVLVPLRLAQLQDKVSIDMSNGPKPRLRLLQKSDLYFELYLRTCIEYGLAESVDVARYEERMERKSSGTEMESNMNRLTMNISRESAETARQRKINNFRRQTQCKKRMKEIERIRNKRKNQSNTKKQTNEEMEDEYLLDGDDEELEREYVLLNVRSGIAEALVRLK
jgi:hypothetical protein